MDVINQIIRPKIKKIKDRYNSLKWSTRPEFLNIELTSICDAKCIHCPRHLMDRPMKPMGLPLFQKIIEQAALLKIPTICPNGFGELLTLNNLEEYLKVIRHTKGHRFKIFINTNANQMNEHKRNLFLKYRVDFLNICIDGATAKTISQVRKKLSPEKIENNIIELINLRNKQKLSFPKIRVGFVSIPQNQHERLPFIKKWQHIADSVGIDGYSNRMGGVDLIKSMSSATSMPACVLPFHTLNIWSNGQCVICCNDWNAESGVGNINNQSLKDIWRGDKLKSIRLAHFKGQGNQVEACKKCNHWQAPAAGQKLWY